MNRTVLAVAIVLAVAFCGCKSKEPTATHEHKMGQHEEMGHSEGMEKMGMKEGMKTEGGVIIRKARKDEIGTPAVCPVMGTKFKVKGQTSVAEYEDKSYPLCCASCIDSVRKNPEKYLK